MNTANRGTIILPPVLNQKFRESVRESDGDAIADAPIPQLIRYWIAKGIGEPDAAKYLRPLPRGNSRASQANKIS